MLCDQRGDEKPRNEAPRDTRGERLRRRRTERGPLRGARVQLPGPFPGRDLPESGGVEAGGGGSVTN